MTNLEITQIRNRFSALEHDIDAARFADPRKKTIITNRLEMCRADLDRLIAAIRGKNGRK